MRLSWIPLRNQIGRVLKIILPKETTVRILQGRLRGKKWILGSRVLEYALGSFEWEKAKLLERIIKKTFVVYDIGAHVGYYTLLAAQPVGEKGKVIAFEPLPRNVKYLRRHVEMNRCSNVMIIEAAVTDKRGKSSFDTGRDSFTGHLSQKGDLQIITVSIDELIAARKIPHPDLMKINVEGAEMHVLEGARLTLTRYEPEILLSTHSDRLHERCIDFLVSLDYKPKHVTGNDLYGVREIFAQRLRSQTHTGKAE
jgi:FkbM family methyltransferase